MLFVCSTHALTYKVGVAAKPLSLQLEGVLGGCKALC